MEKRSRFAIRRYTNLEAMKGDEYEYWQRQPAQERMEAVAEIAAEAYGLKDLPPNAFRLQRILIHLKR